MIAMKEALKRIGIYLKNRLWDRVKDKCVKACQAFVEALWSDIKEEVKACAQEIIKDAEIFLTSVEAQEKEKIILDAVMSKIELPFVLKPFKGIVRRILKSKIEETVQGLLKKGKDFVA